MKINVIKYKKVKSTNDTALKLIKKNITNPTLITTEKQTNGRGTVGKKWVSETGNLFISLFFKFDQKKINFKQFAILNAFLLRKVLSKIIPKKIKIKWPNDLLVNQRKFCGILQEVIRFNDFDYLIVENGHHWSPRIPTFEGDFSGELMLSHQFKNNEYFKDNLC